MHLTDVLSELDNSEYERLHNIVVGVFGVVLECWTMFTPYALSETEAQILIKVGSLLRSTDRVSQSVYSSNLCLIL